MRILYLGLPLGALCLARAGFPPVAAALGPLDLPGRRGVRQVLGRAGTLLLGLPDLHDAEVRRTLRTARPDAVLSWFWPRLVPAAVIETAALGAFGTHPSLLPRWRGPDPYFHAIRAGDAETGVTLHRLAPEYDTGPVVAQRRVRIDADDDAWSLARKLDRPALELLVWCAERLAAGDALAGEPQAESEATWAAEPSDAELAIEWKAPADAIVRLVRAAAPAPGASALLGETSVVVMRASRWAGELPRALVPAEAMRTDGGLVVRALDAGVLVERVRTSCGDVLEGAAVCALV